MNKEIYHNALSLEKAASLTNQLPVLPYNDHPLFAKGEKQSAGAPLEPIRVFDHAWWAGSKAVGSIIIDTGDGLILIDTGSNSLEAEWIAKSIEKIGLNPADIRLIVISHEHFDHYGGLSYFKEKICPEAYVAFSRTGWNLLQTAPTEFAYIGPRPEHVDIFLEDGLCLKVGNTNLYCTATPGHSPGCMSFIFNDSYQGREINVGMMGGSAVWPDLPEIRLYQNSVEYFKLFTDKAECDAFTAVHQKKETLDQVKESWNGKVPHPWLCTKETFDSACLDEFRTLVRTVLKSHEIQTYKMFAGPDQPLHDEGSPVAEWNQK